jgi:DNA-binding MarR family transcriptional regulator
MPQHPTPIAELLALGHQHWPEQAQRINPSALLLYRARDLLLADLEAVLKPFGMLPADLDVLVALRIRSVPRQLTPTELYRSLLLSSGGLTKILHRLEAAGWIDRPANPSDRRSRLVRLTDSGHGQAEQVMEAVIAHEERCLAPLDAGEQAELARLLGKLVNDREC